jgi:hypothetical protein
MPRFVMWRGAVDHDGDSYGFFRNLKSLQDEKNQRRSRALFISNSRRLIMKRARSMTSRWRGANGRARTAM